MDNLHGDHTASPGSGGSGQSQDPMLAQALAELRDIHLPQAEGWWPPAPGWWILSASLFALLCFLSAKGIPFVRSRWQYRRTKGQVLQNMRSIQRQIQDTPNHELSSRIIEPLFSLVKRFVLMHSGENRHPIGGLHGSGWLDFLARHGRFNLNGVDTDSREQLLSLPYVSPSFWASLDPEQTRRLRDGVVQLCDELISWVKGVKIDSLPNLKDSTKVDLSRSRAMDKSNVDPSKGRPS